MEEPDTTKRNIWASGARALAGLVARLTATAWRWERDPRALSALLGRYGAHLAVLSVAVVIGSLGQIALPDVPAAAPPQPFSRSAVAQPVATPTSEALQDLPGDRSGKETGIPREANPLTTIPERQRLSVITYTVQAGDNVSSIAEKFKLAPSTIVWANMELLLGAPWLIQPGQTFYIPPVDGAYHTVREDDTIASIAETYEVDTSALYNTWNDVEPGEPLAAGTLLVVPGGVGAEFDWEPPPPEPSTASARAGLGYLANPDVSHVAARGTFILPTGSYAVSGYVFGDWRNPRHGGLDYACAMNDFIYAADSGVVDWVVGFSGGYGNLVRITHSNGFQTYYAHLNAFAVSVGQTVYQGQVIGYCGTTGLSTGTHLHYEIRLNGVPQNPRLYEP